MANLFWVYIPITVLCLIVIPLSAVFVVKKKEKGYIVGIAICMFLVIFIIADMFSDTSPIKDMIYQETTVITAEFVDSRVNKFEKYLLFENNGEEIKLGAPLTSKIYRDMKIGCTYRIEYYNYSKTIKEYELIE